MFSFSRFGWKRLPNAWMYMHLHTNTLYILQVHLSRWKWKVNFWVHCIVGNNIQCFCHLDILCIQIEKIHIWCTYCREQSRNESRTDVRSVNWQGQISSLNYQHVTRYLKVIALTEPLCIIDELMAIWRRCEVSERLSDSVQACGNAACKRDFIRSQVHAIFFHPFYPQSCRLEGIEMSQIAETSR